MAEPYLPPVPDPAAASRRLYLAVLGILQLTMGTQLLLLLLREQWMHAVLLGVLMAAILAPLVARGKRHPFIPLELQIVVVLFLFATLFLGELLDYYERIWWWDLALHGTAGLLLGLVGFMIVFILNEDEAVDLHMRPSFVALFAFFFSVGLGALWELLEFGLDQAFGWNMQKPMWNDPSGLTNTMWDLILDSTGAAIASIAGWRYMKRARKDYFSGWARRFVERHPHLFEPKRSES